MAKIPPNLTNPLKHSKICVGSRAFDIYVQGCSLFGWDRSKGQIFAVKNMYAEMTDNNNKEIAVWFIGNSNLTEQHEDYINTVFPHENWKITEELIDKSKTINPHSPKRLIFIKDTFEEYIFAGVYERTNVDDENKTSTFTRIDKTYPSRKI